MVALAALVGLVAGIGAVVFEYLSQFVFHISLTGLAGYAPPGPHGENHLFHNVDAATISIVAIIVLPALGGLVSGFICFRFAPEARGHGTDAAIESFHHREGRIRGRVPAIKAITTAISLGTGGSGGREGPIAQIGAGFGSWLATALSLTSRQRRTLLAAGMGAGVGAIFRAPLAGAIFSAEILYREAEIESDCLLPSFVASTVGYCVFCGWLGDFSHLFLIPDALVFNDPHELIPYTVLALVLVPVIWLYIKVFYGVESLFERVPGPKALAPMLGGLLTGLIGVALWKSLDDERGLSVMAYGYGFLQQGLEGSLTGWSGIRLLVLVALGKILTTSFTIGSGGSGGVFGPSMVIGGGIGGAVGIFAHDQGWVENPASFIVVGMTGFFAGAARTPLSTIIMVSEMTGSYELLLPAMWVCALTFIFCTPWTLYHKQVKNRGYSPAHRGEFMVPLLQDMQVSEVLEDRPFPVVHVGTRLKDILRTVAETHADYFPVVDDDGRMVGIFSAHDVREQTYDDTLHLLAVAADIMTLDPITVTPDDDLHVALDRFNRKNIDELPVVDREDSTRLVGMLRRRAITRAYNDKLRQLSAERDEP
ncbi:MAG: chloride channel protein [Planctomycetes bacterium]|nr:chloride channel protein [Planctomycetota bacterium]